MYDIKKDLHGLLLSYYIKYEKLSHLCQNRLHGISNRTIDIYIDISDMLKQLYTVPVYTEKRFLITSSIINVAAHYRGFFRSRYRLHTRIFLVHGTNEYKYSEKIDFEKNNERIFSQLELVRILCAYIPDVYFVKKDALFPVVAYSLIRVCPIKTLTLVITKSKFAYQLIGGDTQNVIILRPKKTKDGDSSYIVDTNNLYYAYFDSITSTSTIDKMTTFNPRLISLLMTLTNTKSLSSLMPVPTAVKIVENAIVNKSIINGYNSDIDFVYKVLCPNIEKYASLDQIKYRFLSTDLLSLFRFYANTAEAMDNTWYINCSDPKAFKEISNKYFVDNPLDVNNL